MIKTWDEIKDLGWSNLLLGNGFSTNIWNKYSYKSLHDYSIANKVEPILNENIQEIFSKLNTINFEEVLKALAYAIIVKTAMGEDTEEYLKLYATVQRNLFNTVHAVHVDFKNVKKAEICLEIKQFEKVFTTSYDLILYWSAFEQIGAKTSADFFWNDNSSFELYNSELDADKSISFYYLHGALHLQQDLNGIVSKISGTAKTLPSETSFKYRGSKTKVPMFISEGTSEYKLNKIKSNSYLDFCYTNFSQIDDSLVVVGHSLDENFDDHLVQAIVKNTKLNRVAISIYSALSVEEKNKLAQTLTARLYRENLEVIFFESSSYPLINESVKVQA
jgi:hypothetical protein